MEGGTWAVERLLDVERPALRAGTQLNVKLRWAGRDSGAWDEGRGDWEPWEDSWVSIEHCARVRRVEEGGAANGGGEVWSRSRVERKRAGRSDVETQAQRTGRAAAECVRGAGEQG